MSWPKAGILSAIVKLAVRHDCSTSRKHDDARCSDETA